MQQINDFATAFYYEIYARVIGFATKAKKQHYPTFI